MFMADCSLFLKNMFIIFQKVIGILSKKVSYMKIFKSWIVEWNAKEP